MKKFILILSILLSLSLGVCLCACGEEKDEGVVPGGQQQQQPQEQKPEEQNPTPQQPEDKEPEETNPKPQQPEETNPEPQEPEEKDPEDKEPENPTPQQPENPDGEDTLVYRITLKAKEGCKFEITDKTMILIYRNSNVYKIIEKAEESQEIVLPRDKYIVRADNLDEPYLQTVYCEMSVEKPYCEIVIGDNPDYEETVQGLVNVGDKMFDFRVKDTCKEPEEFKQFYELAKGKELIYLDFFFTACQPCEYLLDEHLKFYNTLEQDVKDKILMIMIDNQNNETRERINIYRAEKNIPSEIITMAQGGKIFKHVDNNGASPHGLFFDSDLKCFESANGANFEKYVRERLMGETPKTSAFQGKSAYAALPGKIFFLPEESGRRETV